MRVALYARYSTDNQGETSIEGQFSVCRAHAEHENWLISDVFEDRAMSGADPRRPGYNALLQAGRAGRYDLILVEEVSRLWRSQGEQWRCVEELDMLGLHVVGVRDGIDTRRDGFELLLAVQGAMNARSRKETAWRTHRGLSVVVANGLFAGGIAYGYRSVAVGHDERGRPTGFRLEIREDEAVVVRRIFEEYAAGRSPRTIAHELNRSGIPSPRGSTWAVSALYGSPAKGTGILNNELYAGRYVWNRSQWRKDLRTGKRKRVERARSDWKIAERPDLKIVPDGVWQAVRGRMAAPGIRGGGSGRGRRPSSLFGGLLRCGLCGGSVVAVDKYRYGCANAKDRGTCPGIHSPRSLTDTRLLSTIRDELLSPASLAKVQAGVQAALRNMRDTAADTKKREADLAGEIRNLTDAVAVAGLSQALRDRLAVAEAELARIRSADQRPARADPAAVLARFKRLMADLHGSLSGSPESAREALRRVFGGIRLTDDGGAIYAEIEASADRLLMASGDASKSGSGGRI